jgi:N-acetylmuramoyl-L-alanine amidase
VTLRRPEVVAALASLSLWAALAAPGIAVAASQPGATAPVVSVGGVRCLGANDLARLLDGSLYWRADTRKLVVRAQGHRLTFTADAPLVLVDDRTVRLDAPVLSVGGELQISLALLPLLPRDSSAVRLVVDSGGMRVRATPADGWVATPRVAVAGELTRVTLDSARPGAARITGSAREHFRIWLPGAAASASSDTLPAGSLVTSMRRLPAADGVTWELALAGGTAGYRRTSASDAVVLEFARSGSGLDPFAPEGPEGPRALRVIVLDAGHGGEDAGVSVPGALEKNLTLQLARILAPELERRTGARVVLTRTDDRALAQPERAELANRARADLVLSLHFDGAPLTRASGATAWCPTLGASAGDDVAPTGGIPLMRWRDVAVRHAVESRSLADAVTAALEVRGLGPARVRERLPVPLLGVNAPGIVLECATLTSAADLARVSGPDGLHALALAIADGVQAWGRHE